MLYERARDIALNAIRPSAPVFPSDRVLLQELAELQPELKGFPVAPLLEVFVTANEQERLSAFHLVESCLSSWIAQLDKPVTRVYGGLPEAFEKIEARRRGARDALARVHAALSGAQVVPSHR
ncbi:hypothetical protein [Roseateles puraquae]|uniref:hypothetical protein n=1 Tax=Roseateles puraquae TaxID=431059 RepID=UPI0031D24A43